MAKTQLVRYPYDVAINRSSYTHIYVQEEVGKWAGELPCNFSQEICDCMGIIEKLNLLQKMSCMSGISPRFLLSGRFTRVERYQHYEAWEILALRNRRSGYGRHRLVSGVKMNATPPHQRWVKEYIISTFGSTDTIRWSPLNAGSEVMITIW